MSFSPHSDSLALHMTCEILLSWLLRCHMSLSCLSFFFFRPSFPFHFVCFRSLNMALGPMSI